MSCLRRLFHGPRSYDKYAFTFIQVDQRKLCKIKLPAEHVSPDITLGSPATWLLTQLDVRSLPSVAVASLYQYCYTSLHNRNSSKPTLRETMEKTAPGMHAPMAVNVTVRRPTRPREYLTEREIEKLIKAAGENRWGHRDATAILIAYRHGLRASELVALRWDDIDFQTGKLHVRRAKGGTASVHPIGGRELRALRRLKREAPAGVYVFVSERLAPLSVAGYQRMVARAGEAAGFPFLVHSHMLRHSCGYKLANDGQDTRAIQHYLGHKSINSTVRYTALAPDRFKGFWKD
jgi:type 1 fimbriae regulatory protein FimE